MPGRGVMTISCKIPEQKKALRYLINDLTLDTLDLSLLKYELIVDNSSKYFRNV